MKELNCLATPIKEKKGLLRSIHTTQANGVPVKVVFVRNRNKKSEWLAYLYQGILAYFSLQKLSN